MSSEVITRSGAFPLTRRQLVLGLVAATALLIAFRVGLIQMAVTWLETEEYSHGILIPAIAAFLIWQRKEELTKTRWTSSWAGLLIVVAAALLNLLAQMATVFTLQQYAFVIALCGVVVTLGGWSLLRFLAVPMLVLLFMIPLPNFFTNGLSAQLQLVSSQLGVWFIRLFGVSVHLEGNVIDLGTYQLQVAEACSGLRYLFPLMTLGFIMAYFYKVALWKRALLFVSTMPITVLLNSLRIGLIGVTVDKWGIEAAEGMLHDFEGWAVFMASTAVLLAEMIALSKIGRDPRPWREVFGMQWPTSSALRVRAAPLSVPKPFVSGAVVLSAFAAVSFLVSERQDVLPARASLVEFPMLIEQWRGRRESLDSVYLDTLQLDDYVMADFRSSDPAAVNFYVAWYDSQRGGQSAHSPRSCLPGGGWRITDLRQMTLADVVNRGEPLRVNRVLIRNGEHQQLVYYWFQQRGRNLTNEYLVKWYLSWDSLTQQRTDGALIRLISPVMSGEDVAAADERLREFAAAIVPELPPYIPG